MKRAILRGAIATVVMVYAVSWYCITYVFASEYNNGQAEPQLAIESELNVEFYPEMPDIPLMPELPIMPDEPMIETGGYLLPQAPENPQVVNNYVTLDRVNLRQAPAMDAPVYITLNRKTQVSGRMVDNPVPGWTAVSYNGMDGFIKSEYIGSVEQYESLNIKNVELIPWSQAKGIFQTGVPAEVVDVRTGAVYYVKSFSNGLHADVEPVTVEDTNILKRTFGNVWSWDVRPVWVTINGVTMAGSINGMPHGGGVNGSNGMNGQICIHFQGSTTHNGNASFARLHQNGVVEAYNASR